MLDRYGEVIEPPEPPEFTDAYEGDGAGEMSAVEDAWAIAKYVDQCRGGGVAMTGLSWRDEFDLACLSAFDSVEVAEFASRHLQSLHETALNMLGLPADLWDVVDDVLGEQR